MNDLIQQQQPINIYDRMTDPAAAMVTIGTAIAKSRFFGADNVDQGIVLALECMKRGLSPLMLQERYHIIEGKLSMRADAMLAEFNRSGGKHRIVSRTEERAEIELEFNGQKYSESFTWEEAKGEPFVYGKEQKIKKNWATPRARKQMLWARVVSDSIRALMPGVNSGRYTPEECEDFAGERSGGNGNGFAAPVDVAFTTVVDEVKSQPVEAVNPLTAPCRPEQIATIYAYWKKLNIPIEAQQKQLAKRGVPQADMLSEDQATELIGKLIGAFQATDQPAETVEPAPAPQLPDNGGARATDLQVETSKTLMKKIDTKTIEAIKAHLVAHGKNKIVDLREDECELLVWCLQKKDLTAFLELKLRPVDGTAGTTGTADVEVANEPEIPF